VGEETTLRLPSYGPSTRAKGASSFLICFIRHFAYSVHRFCKRFDYLTCNRKVTWIRISQKASFAAIVPLLRHTDIEEFVDGV
jgi:hypothetical protein